MSPEDAEAAGGVEGGVTVGSSGAEWERLQWHSSRSETFTEEVGDDFFLLLFFPQNNVLRWMCCFPLTDDQTSVFLLFFSSSLLTLFLSIQKSGDVVPYRMRD